MTLDLNNYFSHEADMGIIGRGDTIERAFESAAESVFGLMADLQSIQPKDTVEIKFEEEDLELALVTWLNLLINEAVSRNMIFSEFKLQRDQSHWKGQARGQPWREEFSRGVEVKGATLTMLSVKEIPSGWEARCVVDV